MLINSEQTLRKEAIRDKKDMIRRIVNLANGSFLCRTPSFRTTSSSFVLTQRARSFPICATDGQQLPTFLKKFPCFARKSTTFCNNKGRYDGRETQKRTAPQFIVQSFCISIQTASKLFTFFGRSSLCCSGSRIVSRVDGFLCSAFCCSFGLLFHGLCTGCRRVLHLATASLGFLSCTLRAVFHGFCALLSSSLCLGGSFTGSFLAFSASLLALGGLFCGGMGSLLSLGAGFLCALFAARFHCLLSGFRIHLHHLRGSGGTYGKHGGESQTAKEGIEIKFHYSVVLVVISIRIGVSFVKTHGVIFYRRLVFPVCACKCNAKAWRKQIKSSEYGGK